MDDLRGGAWVGQNHKLSKPVPLMSPRLALRAPGVKYMFFKWCFGSPGPGEPNKKQFWRWRGGGKTNNIKTHLKICLIRAPGVKHMISM